MVYFDNAATTRVDRQVADEILRVMCEEFGNPSSLHAMGLSAQRLFERAGQQLLTAVRATSGQIVFTSGGTESNNLAIFGASAALMKRGKRVILSSLEHSSVDQTFRELANQGFDVRVVPCDKHGYITPEALAEHLSEDTILVSIMLVNNEVGTIQPIPALVSATRAVAKNAVFHCDAVQALGKIPIEASKWDIDLMSLSGHKLHAPKGIGALYVKKGVRIIPRVFGGGQQNALKPGTESVPLAVGMGLAAKLATESLAQNSAHVNAVRAHLISELAHIPEVRVLTPNGDVSPYILSINLPGYKSETLLHALEAEDVYVSSGSACSKGAKSHVLIAMGLSPQEVDGALRISLSKDSTIEQADQFIKSLKTAVARLTKRPIRRGF